MIKRLLAVTIAVSAFYCTREGELRATYVNVRGVAELLPCDNRYRMWHVNDSTLAAEYVKQGGGRMYVRAYGKTLDSGSVYGSSRTFVVRQILEMRPAKAGECWVDTAATPLASLPTQPVNPEVATTLVTFVQRFYDWYVPLMLKGKAGPAWDVTLKSRGASMDSGLVRALKEDGEAAAKNANEVVGLDFDPFTATQDPCTSYQARATRRLGERYLVDVHAVCDGKRRKDPDLVAELEQRRGLWVFVNFRYPDGDDLVATLKKLKADRAHPAQ